MAHIFPQTDGLCFCITLVAQRPVIVLDKSLVGQLYAAILAAEALRMPAGVHCLDNTPDDKLIALAAARRKQHLKVVLAVLTTLKLIKQAVFELLKALCTTGNIFFKLCYDKNILLDNKIGILSKL